METVVYSKAHGQPIRMDIYHPQAGKSPTAGLLVIHGGGWVSGGRAQMAELAEYVASHGALAASIDYRLAPTNRWPAQLDDVQTAVRYLRANAAKLNIDPKKIGSFGISAGGHLSLFLGSVDSEKPQEYPQFSSRVEAVGSISGLHDLRLKMTPEGESYKIVEALTGARSGPVVDAASPILGVDKHTAPTYFIQGADDPWVPPDQTATAFKKLSGLGVPTVAVTVPKMGHGLTLAEEPQKVSFGAMIDWMLKRLNGTP